MVGLVLGALRPILALAIAGGIATVAVAPAFDMAQQRSSQALTAGAAPVRHDSKQEFERLLRLCLETRDPDSTECLEAAVASDLSFEAFRVKVVALLDPATASSVSLTKQPEPTKDPEPAKPEPAAKPASTNDFEIFFKKCVESRDLRSDPCESAYQLSGMSSDDFDAKVQAKIDAATQSEFALWFQKCLDSRDLNSDKCLRARELSGLNADQFRTKFDAKVTAVAPKDSGDFGAWFEKCLATRDVRSDACFRAQQLIGFSDADFKAKFERYLAERDAKFSKPTPAPVTSKDGGDFWAWFEKCLDTRDVRSDACFRAQQLIGFNDADFKSKFERYLAERDAKLGKPAQPVSNLDTIFNACGQTHMWSSTACLEAYVLSGMQTAEFRTKLTAKFGAFH